MSRRVILSLVLALSALGLTTGLTASLEVAAADLGAGSSVVSACDANGIDVAFGVAVDGTSVSEVTLSDVDAACDTQAVTVSLEHTDGTVTQVLGTADASTSLTLPVSPAAPAGEIDAVNVVITG